MSYISFRDRIGDGKLNVDNHKNMPDEYGMVPDHLLRPANLTDFLNRNGIRGFYQSDARTWQHPGTGDYYFQWFGPIPQDPDDHETYVVVPLLEVKMERVADPDFYEEVLNEDTGKDEVHQEYYWTFTIIKNNIA